jgi:hypothetical protein
VLLYTLMPISVASPAAVSSVRRDFLVRERQGEYEMTVQAEQESFSFQAEAVQILDLMVHSLYSNKEIFLRDLISNASDAIDRLRLELLSRAELPDDEGPLQIRVTYDKDARARSLSLTMGSA